MNSYDCLCPVSNLSSNILRVVALVLLLSALFNYINLTVAQIGNRAKEMATRRLLGESVGGVEGRVVQFATPFACGLILVHNVQVFYHTY